MKIVLDSNFILSAFGTHGLCEAIMAICLEKHEIILSEHILAEVEPRLTGKFKLPAGQAREITSFLRSVSRLVEPATVHPNACRDPDDLPILGTALAAKADFLVTGDNDLLILGQFEQIPILSPRDFYKKIQSP